MGFIEIRGGLGEWEISARWEGEDPQEAARFLEKYEGVLDEVLIRELRKEIPLEEPLAYLSQKKTPEEVAKASKGGKLGKMVNEAVGERDVQKKQLKLLRELVKIACTRKVLRDMGYGFRGGEVPEGEGERFVFMAQVDRWVSVKKLSLGKNTTPLDISQFLASVLSSFYRKILEWEGDTASEKRKLIELGAKIDYTPVVAGSIPRAPGRRKT